jgi:hypothetical protein
VSDIHLRGDEKSPFWMLLIDGDEVLDKAAVPEIQHMLSTTKQHAFRFRIPYLWNDRKTLRVDGVYGEFRDGIRARPSLFRLMNSGFRFQRTPYGCNFHCSSIPQELLSHAHHTFQAPLWHLGYMEAADRIRKYEYYNLKDPNNASEDQYKHMVIGDVFPPDAKFRHAGPLKLEAL